MVLTYKSQRISSPVLILDKLLLHKEAWSVRSFTALKPLSPTESLRG